MRFAPEILITAAFLGATPGIFAAKAAEPARVLVMTAYSGNYLDIYDERIYKSCRKKVRRELGKARGKHVRALRLSFTQTCMINGGSHW